MGQTLMPVFGARRTGKHAGGVRQRYVLDERGRRLITESYDGTTETIDRLTHTLGVPRWTVIRWAGQLGLRRQKEPGWTDTELAYLETRLHRMSIPDIARHLGRTQIAVRVMAKKIGVAKGDNGYTMRRLEDCLGADHHKIERWIDRGWLKGTRRQTDRNDKQGGDMWYFSDEAIRHFIIHHPEEIDQRRVGWLWVVDLLAGGLGELGKEE